MVYQYYKVFFEQNTLSFITLEDCKVMSPTKALTGHSEHDLSLNGLFYIRFEINEINFNKTFLKY